MAETQRFGLTKTVDNDIIDRLFAHFEEHRHDGGGLDGLADPSDAPTAVVNPTGGTLANGVDLYYRVSFVDANGLETVASDELEVVMPPIPVVSQEPVPTAATLAGSTLPDNTYFYALTANAPAGETALGPQAIITVVPGQNHVDLALPTLPDGADSYNVWRMGTGEEGWTEVGAQVATATFADTGFASADCPCDPASQPPTDNFGTATNSVTITTPDTAIVGADPSAVQAWRIYRTDTSGVYGDSSLLAQVATTTGETSGPLVTTYIDTGGDLLPGTPNNTSTALHPSRPIVLPAGTELPDDVTGYAPNTPFVLTTGGTRALYVLVGTDWQLVAGGSGGGGGGTGGGGGGGSSLAHGTSAVALMTNTADYIYGSVSPSPTDTYLNVARFTGHDVHFYGYGNLGGLVIDTDGVYLVYAQAYVTGLVAGDAIEIAIGGLTYGPGVDTERFTVPNGATDLLVRYFEQHTLKASSGPVTCQLTAYQANGAAYPMYDSYEFGVELIEGTPAAPPDLTKLPGQVGNLNVAANNPGSGTIYASSFPPANSNALANVGLPIRDYRFRAVNVADPTEVHDVFGPNNGDSSMGITGLTPGVTYEVTVQARNVYGWGAPAVGTATPQPPAPVTLPYTEEFNAGGDADLNPLVWQQPTGQPTFSEPVKQRDGGYISAGSTTGRNGEAWLDMGLVDQDVTAEFWVDGSYMSAFLYLAYAAADDFVRVEFDGFSQMSVTTANPGPPGQGYPNYTSYYAGSFDGHNITIVSPMVTFANSHAYSKLRAVLDGTSLKLYQDGTLRATTTLATPRTGTKAGFLISAGNMVRINRFTAIETGSDVIHTPAIAKANPVTAPTFVGMNYGAGTFSVSWTLPIGGQAWDHVVVQAWMGTSQVVPEAVLDPTATSYTVTGLTQLGEDTHFIYIYLRNAFGDSDGRYVAGGG